MDLHPDLRARRITPTRDLPDDRLQLPSVPCAACGGDVDPLRTPSILAFEDGVRYLCDDRCATSYRAGARSRRRPQLTATTSTPSTPTRLAAQPGPATSVHAIPPPPAQLPLAPEAMRWLFLGLVAVLVAAILACFETREVALFAALSTGVAAAAALRLSAASFAKIGVFAWLCGPAGVLGAALAGYLESNAGSGHLAQLGAAFASLVLLMRAYLDLRAGQPVEGAVQHLRAHLRTLPADVPSGVLSVSALLAGREPAEIGFKLPASGASEPMAPERERPEKALEPIAHAAPANDLLADRARIGEELVVRRGERIAVDGVVQFGEAMVLPFPTATTAILRRPGDTLLAGATIVDGALRVLATRIGEDRSLARALRSGQVHPREGAPLVRLCSELSRYGGLVSLFVGLGLLVWGDPESGVLPLAAASALLIASPWLAVRRAAEWPFTAAATAAAARGVLYQNGAALELAGHVGVVAMAPHRTLTEGNPEVVELHTLGDESADQLLGLVAAAELATDHAIARAILKYAEARGAPLAEVRRSVSVPGRGVTALGPTGEEVVVGSRRLLLDHGVSVALAESHAARAEALGRTVVFVSIAGRVRAVFALHDQLRGGARLAVQRMFDMGLEIVLLTGGQRAPVEQLASRLDIAHIKAELLAEERGNEVRSLRDAGSRVAVIGFPADDNPALSAADVGVALGAAGGPSGDRAIALVGEDVRDAAAALWIARAARQGALNSVRIAIAAFLGACTAAASGLLEPVTAALLALAIDAHCIHTGARLLRRIALRLPPGS